jgi:hypothetical protein
MAESSKILTRDQVKLRLEVAWRYKYTLVQVEAARQIDESDAALRELVAELLAVTMKASEILKKGLANTVPPLASSRHAQASRTSLVDEV